MSTEKFRVAIIGCGRLGQEYATAYSTYHDTEIVAIAEINEERRKAVGKRFGVKALYPDAPSLLRDIVPDIAAVVTPTKYMHDAVIACAEAGVKGVSTDKPIAAKLSDADEMVETCKKRGVVFAGGILPRAMHEMQEVANRLHSGVYGPIRGASVHRFGEQISGAGCQHISILRLWTNAEVQEVIAWGKPAEILAGDSDDGLVINGSFRMTNGMQVPVFGPATPYRGVEIWTDDTLVRFDWAVPEVYRGFDKDGKRIKIDPKFAPYEYSQFRYMTGSIRSFLAAVRTGSQPWVTGHDLRQALEVAIASKLSAQLGSAPVRLPLKDRSLTLYPVAYRFLGGDATGRVQTAEEAEGIVKEK